MIAIIDYGVGNLFSLASSLKSLGLETKVTRDAAAIRAADHIILPGVGAFADASWKPPAWCPLSSRKWSTNRFWASAWACSCCLKKAMSTANTPALA